MQNTATYYNILQHTVRDMPVQVIIDVIIYDIICATHCNTMQNTATHCNTLQHTLRDMPVHVIIDVIIYGVIESYLAQTMTYDMI